MKSNLLHHNIYSQQFNTRTQPKNCKRISPKIPYKYSIKTLVDSKSRRVTAGLVTTDIDGQLARRHGNDTAYHIINLQCFIKQGLYAVFEIHIRIECSRNTMQC